MICNSGLLWSGSVGEPTSLNKRIEECERKCEQNANCKFMDVRIVNDWCQTHSSCDITRAPNSAGITFAKTGNICIQLLFRFGLGFYAMIHSL